MAKPRVSAGGGPAALAYVWKKGREAGGFRRLLRRLRSHNTCKTCAFGMGGARGGMVNEAGQFPEVCKKSVQAQAGDMAPAIAEETFAATSLEEMGRWTSARFERLGRLTFPIAAGPGDAHFRRIRWDEAMRLGGHALAAADPARVFWYASGRSGNEAAFLLQLVARASGCANIHNCSYYCHAASGVALSKVYGTGTASVVLDDLSKADVVLLAGANPASNHPRMIERLVKLRRRGGQVIVVNPLRELGLRRFRVPSDARSMLFGSDVAGLYLQPHVGGDVALFKALLKAVMELGGEDRKFLAEHTSGWAEVRADVRECAWERLTGAAGVERAEVTAAAAALCRARNGIFAWAMGLTHHVHGVDNILALSNLALALGWLGRPGAGLLPLRGHSNVQGVGSVGVTPALKAAFARKLEELYDIRVPADAGQDTFASMEAAANGRIDAAVLLGGNLWGSNPDLRRAGRALRRIRLTLSLTTKLNPGHVHGRGETAVIVPVLARDEEHQATTQESMFNFVRMSSGGRPSLDGEMRSEVEILAALAERLLPEGRFEWSELRSHRKLRDAISLAVPGFRAIGDIDATRREFQIDGRTFHGPRFATEDGRAGMHVTPLPAFAPGDGEFRLMTLRSEGQFNTVVYDEEDLYRGNRRRDVVMMARQDVDGLGVKEGDAVTVSTETGELTVRAAIVDIRPGSAAMYYPEANALVPARIDPLSRTPAFKSVAARISRASAGTDG